jgi:site-specific recombinase XerD
MAIEDSYTYQQSILIKQKIEEILLQLPKCCSDYIYAKISAEKFQPRTRLAYLQELLLFFKYLCDSHEDFMDYKPSDIPTEMLKKLTTQDIEAYLSYCELYVGENGARKNKAPGKARKLAAIRSLFKYLVGRNVLTTNVAANVETPTIPKHDVVFMNSPTIFSENTYICFITFA